MAELHDLPEHVRRQVAAHVWILGRSIGRADTSLTSDVLCLLNCPAVRAYISEDWPASGIARWAAVSSAFVADVRNSVPLLLAEYVRDLLPCVALVVAPAADMFRMAHANEFRMAARNQSLTHLRLSLLGPLALFFLESVARAHFAWDVLVEPCNAPSRAAPFGWAPSLDFLPAVLRFALMGQVGRRIRRKAMLDCPLARYLVEMGLVHPVAVPQAAGSNDNRWLLSGEYISSCAGTVGPKGALLVCDPAEPSSDEAYEPVIDRRTGRRIPSPQEELEVMEARNRLLAAARSLVGRYVSSPKPQVKRLALWAHVADVDPVVLLSPPESLGEDVLAALAEAALRRRARQASPGQLNAAMREPALAIASGGTATFTSAQCRTYLTRLRQEFRSELGDEL